VIGNHERVALVVCVVPGGFDRFFTACAEEFKKGEPEMPVLVKLAAKHGIEFQSGPGLSGLGANLYHQPIPEVRTAF